MGGETPCVSTIAESTADPPATGILNTDAATGIVNARQATKPTVTVTGTVFAMQYALADAGGGTALSPGAIAGIAIAGVLAVGAAVGLGILMWRHYQNARKARAVDTKLHDDFDGIETGISAVPASKDMTAVAMTPLSPLPPAYTPVDRSSPSWWCQGGAPRAELHQQCLCELPAGSDEVQLAHPQWLLRRQPRVVHTTRSRSSTSTTKERMDKEPDMAESPSVSAPSSTTEQRFADGKDF